MKLLLDTHTFYRWDQDPDQLSTRVCSLIEDPGQEVFVSVVSIWEIIIKSELKKLALSDPISEILTKQQANGLQLLPVIPTHVLAVVGLPVHHKDPFDRMLVAQAMAENAVLLTKDQIIRQYPVRTDW